MKRAALALLSIAGCASHQPHQQLSVPRPNAAEVERLEAHTRLFAISGAGTAEVIDGTVVDTRPDFLVLGDGTRVYHAEDLAPAVDPSSPTARAGERARLAGQRTRSAARTGGLAMLASAVVTVAGAVLVANAGDDDGQLIVGVSATLGGVVAAVVSGVATVALTSHHARTRDDERATAFATYNRDLRSHLALCVDGARVMACPRVAAAPPAASPDDARSDALGAELQRLRAIPGHFGGGAWSEEADSFGGRKHVILQELGKRLETAPRARIEAVMGPPDAVAQAGDPLWQLAAPTAGATLLVYHWRGTHDFLYFESRRRYRGTLELVDGARVKTRGTIALALIALVAWSSRARADDDWLDRDKALHAVASASLAAGGYAVSSIWLDERVERAAAGAGVALAAGAAKEAWDALGHGDPSWKDAAWDVIGTAIGVGVALLVDSATR